MQTTSSLAPETTIAVIGAGRLGGVLARALRTAGYQVLGPLRREQAMPTVDIALLCVPDAAIAAVAFVARPHARLVGHVSGATPLDDVDFSIHPLQTFTGSETPDVFHGIGAAVALPHARRTRDGRAARPRPRSPPLRSRRRPPCDLSRGSILLLELRARRARRRRAARLRGRDPRRRSARPPRPARAPHRRQLGDRRRPGRAHRTHRPRRRGDGRAAARRNRRVPGPLRRTRRRHASDRSKEETA